MKKIISVLLAVAMLAALMVPSFAAEITKDSAEQSATVDVVTKTTDTAGGDAYSYSVTFPASFEFAWNDTAEQSAVYKVTSQLLLGASLKVSVATNNGGKMTNADTTSFLTYTLSNGGEETFAEVNNDAEPTAKPTVSIASYEGVPIAVYTGTLTYSVTYTAPATP